MRALEESPKDRCLPACLLGGAGVRAGVWGFGRFGPLLVPACRLPAWGPGVDSVLCFCVWPFCVCGFGHARESQGQGRRVPRREPRPCPATPGTWFSKPGFGGPRLPRGGEGRGISWLVEWAGFCFGNKFQLNTWPYVQRAFARGEAECPHVAAGATRADRGGEAVTGAEGPGFSAGWRMRSGERSERSGADGARWPKTGAPPRSRLTFGESCRIESSHHLGKRVCTHTRAQDIGDPWGPR